MLVVFSVFTEQVLISVDRFIVIFKELVLRSADIDEPQLTTADVRDEIGLVTTFILYLAGTLLADDGLLECTTDALEGFDMLCELSRVLHLLHLLVLMEYISP